MKRLKEIIKLLRIVWYSWRFNFHYFPWKQAVKLPVFLWKPEFLDFKGKVMIDGEVYRGKIRLGFRYAKIFKDDGIIWENHGGTVIFRGSAYIGGGSALSVGKDSLVDLGDDLFINNGFKMVSNFGFKTADHNRMGWEVRIMDTNFHRLYDKETSEPFPLGGKIEIGRYNWFATGCRIMHSVKTPERCIFSAGTIVNRKTPMEPYAITGGQPPKILRRGVYRDFSEKGKN